MLRLLVMLALIAGVAYFGSTVKLGQRTFFGHVRAVWSTGEAQDMRKGIEEKAGPALDRVKRGVKAGIKAAAGEGGDGSAATRDAGADGGAAEAPASHP
jgi:chloramphenicol 3-O-phosphotransferase